MTDASQVPFWAEIITAALLVSSGLFALTGALGMLRLKDFFQRMHPPALASTLGAWCVAVATVLYFTYLKHSLALHAVLIPILLAITMPVTTLLLARAALFRKRMAKDAVPAEVSSHSSEGGA